MSSRIDAVTDTDVDVVVADPVPAYRSGLGHHLTQAGLHVRTTDSLTPATDPPPAAVVVITDRADPGWRTLQTVTEHDDTAGVALLTDPTPPHQAIARGASTVLPWDAPLDTMLLAVHAAHAGQRLMTFDAAATADHTSDTPLTPEQLLLLQQVAGGAAIADIAAARFVSTRSVHRHLRIIYRRLGVTNRPQAIISAVQLGLLRLD